MMWYEEVEAGAGVDASLWGICARWLVSLVDRPKEILDWRLELVNKSFSLDIPTESPTTTRTPNFTYEACLYSFPSLFTVPVAYGWLGTWCMQCRCLNGIPKPHIAIRLGVCDRTVWGCMCSHCRSGKRVTARITPSLNGRNWPLVMWMPSLRVISCNALLNSLEHPSHRAFSFRRPRTGTRETPLDIYGSVRCVVAVRHKPNGQRTGQTNGTDENHLKTSKLCVYSFLRVSWFVQCFIYVHQVV